MANKDYVLSLYPNAFVSFNSDKGTFKIFADRETFIALSASCASDPLAWADAARAILERKST